MTKDRQDKKLGKEQQLLEAARLGRLDELESVLGQSPVHKLKKKSNPLASLRRQISPNSVRDPATGFTCLHHAALNGHGECVRLILCHGAKLNALDYKGSSALHLAAWAGNLEVIRILLAYGASASQAQPSEPQACQDQQQAGWMWANCKNLEPLDLDLCNNDNQTALSLAAQFGHSQVLAELLRVGANVHIRNNQLESALDLASLNGRSQTVCILLDSSPELRAEIRRDRANWPEPRRARGRLSPVEHLQCEAQASIEARATGAPASGWSSLLRLSRRTSSNQQQLQGDPSSPSRRPARSPSSVSQQKQLESPSKSWRRATLALGASFDAAQTQKFSSLDEAAGWCPKGVEQHAQQVHDRLLPLAPLHCATKRGHASLISLLLQNYGANLLQVTSNGSVLHEIALNNGKHGDMIGVYFQFISQYLKPENRLEMLSKFLSLQSGQGQTVFQLLDQINNRSAHELKRLIYKLSDQIQAEAGQPARPISSMTVDQHQPQQTSCNVSPLSCQAHQRDPASSQFGGIGHINSFVTMKRLPKRAPATSNKPEAANNFHQQVQFPLAPMQYSQFQQQQQLTRSVSNLNHQPQARPYNQDFLTATQIQHQGRQQALQDVYQSNLRRLKSRSRDFASILLQSQQQQQQQQHQLGRYEPLYDNQPGSGPASYGHLVRSQTDCNSLMSRFFGDQPQKQQHQLAQDVAKRTMINRHYHVYDHQFYPPRLVPGAEPKQPAGETNEHRQNQSLVAVVPPTLLDDTPPGNRLGYKSAELSQREIAPRPASRSLHLFSQSFDQPAQQQVSPQSISSSRRNMIDLQSKLLADSAMQQQQHLTADSQSIDSNLNDAASVASSSHQFESASQAFMQDFDQMLGREFPARDKRSPPPPQAAQIQTGHSRSPSGLSGSESPANQLVRSSSSLSRQYQSRQPSGFSKSIEMQQQQSKPAPSKPPRPSLLSKSQYKLRQLGESAIYDLPSSGQRPADDTSTSSLDFTGAQLASFPAGSGGNMALTVAPTERPPPLPAAASLKTGSKTMMVSPLHIVAPSANCSSGQPMSLPSSSSETSSASSRLQEHGLLRMVSLGGELPRSAKGHSHNKQQQVKFGDQDSGVCTSNSPASLSHDSDRSGKSSQGQKSANLDLASCQSNDERDLEKISSPPSPNTAQQCVEEALMPLAKTKPATKGSHKREQLAERSSHEVVDWWLASASNEPDYDNCRQLGPVGSQRKPESQANVGEQDDQDYDYAESAQESFSSRSPPASGSSDSQASSVASLGKTRRAGQKCRRELTLRVLLDETKPDSGGDKVFYIDPTELGKLSDRSPASQVCMVDAASLTDEDLTAAIDKTSGYIRFTLKKRRNEDESTSEKSTDTGSSNSAGCTQSVAAKADPGEGQLQQSQTSGAGGHESKKSRLVSPLVGAPSAHLAVRRHSELGSGSMGTKTAHDESKLRASHAELAIQGKMTECSHQQLEDLRRWFGSYLPGLVEYQALFASNGLESLKFLNHRRLLDDELLSAIGIDEESHRLLIIETVRNQLPPVDLKAALSGRPLTVLGLVQSLNLSGYNLEPVGGAIEMLDSRAAARLRSISKAWPPGHRKRLEAGLAIIDGPNKVDQGERKLSAQSSVESTEMEISLASNSTSSSSKASIKSIVSAPSKDAPAVGASSVLDSSGWLAASVGEQTELHPDIARASTSASASKHDNCDMADSTIGQVELGASLVDEFARRLECPSENACILPSQLRPAVAKRRINCLPRKEPLGDKSNISHDVSVGGETMTSSGWPPRVFSAKQAGPTNSVSTDAKLSKLAAIRLSYEKQIEDNAKAKSNQLVRPKPAPPAKPAKLVVTSNLRMHRL